MWNNVYRCGQKPVLIFSLLLILCGCSLLSFGPQKVFGLTLSYVLLVVGRFMLAIGSHGVSINGYLLGKIIQMKKNCKHFKFKLKNKCMCSHGNDRTVKKKEVCFNIWVFFLVRSASPSVCSVSSKTLAPFDFDHCFTLFSVFIIHLVSFFINLFLSKKES